MISHSNVKLPEGNHNLTASVQKEKATDSISAPAACRTLLIAGVAVSSVGNSGPRGRSKDLRYMNSAEQRICPVNGSS